MKLKIFTGFLVLLFCTFTFGQKEENQEKKEKIQCPSIEITGSFNQELNETVIFKVSFLGKYDDKKVKIKWSVENGKILKGQGEKSITISYESDVLVVATATINGLPKGCLNKVSETMVCADCKEGNIPPILFDEFRRISYGALRRQLDILLVELIEKPTFQAYIVNYGSIRQVSNRERLFQKHFKYRKFDISRIIFVKGGKEKKIRTRF